MRIGEFLVYRKLLTPTQVEKILEFGRKENLRFGEAGIRLGLISEESLVRIFGKNYRVDFFHLDPKHFPKDTSNAISVDCILKYGVLPLGHQHERGTFKAGQVLNIGMLDPGRMEAIDAVELESKAKVRVFLVLADQFLQILRDVYSVTADEIRKRPPADLDPVLAMFVETHAGAS